MNNKVITLFLVIVGLLLTALMTHNGDIAWMTMPFLVYMVIGLLRAPVTENVRLSAARSVEKINEAGEPCVQVTVVVQNSGPRLDQVFIADLLQSGARLGDKQPGDEHPKPSYPQRRVALRPGERTSVDYRFLSNRGHFAWDTVRVVASDPFGLFETSLEVLAQAEVQVQPAFTRIRPLPLRPQRTLHLSGSIPARLGGSGTDFWGIREYHPGDPLRRIDWHQSARHPGQLFTREFEQEEIADIGLILDARRSTDLRVGEGSLFEHANRAAAALAEVFLRQGNRVSLLVYGEPMLSVYPGYGKVQLNRILNTLSQVVTESGVSLGGLQFLPVEMFSSHSIILILSPLVSGDWLLFPRLRAYGYQVLLVSPDPVDYAQRMLPKDPLSSLSIRLTQVERHLEMSKISRLWIPVINWQVSQPLAPLVRSALNYSHLQRRR